MNHSPMSHRRNRTAARVALGFAATILLAACGQAAATPAATTSTTAVPTSAGPTAFADWTARQGFGGGAGVHNVLKLAKWVWAHEVDATPFDLKSDVQDIDSLIAWLDEHPATPCWASYHDKVRADLAKLDAPYAAAIQALSSGNPVSELTATAIVDAAQAASDEVAPTGCS